MNVGENIQKCRKEKGLTQKGLAEILEVTNATIQNYENNRREPNLEMLKKIATALDVTINELIGNEEIIKLQFENDFDINIFEPRVMKYINDLKQALKNTFPDVEISNTLVLQNIIIDIMANEVAKSAAGMFKAQIMSKFAIGDGKLISGKELYDMLYKKYYGEYKKERHSLLSTRVNFIIQYRLNDNLSTNEINTLKEYYENSPEREIPKEVLKFIK